MPPEEEELSEVLQLRSQGMTYKQIAEKTGHPQSTVAHWCQSNTPKSPQKVEVLMVNDFEPGMTVITLPIHKFEFFRKSELLYFKQINRNMCELFEIRGTIIHKTDFRARGEMYPYFIDMIQDNGSNFVQVFLSSLSKQRADIASRYASTIQTRIDYDVRRHSNTHTESILDLCPHGFVFRDWVADFLHSMKAATREKYTGFYFFTEGVEQQTIESADAAYKRWESLQEDSAEFKQLRQLAQLGDDMLESLFAIFAKEQHRIPKKHAKIALEINSLDAKKIKHFVDSGASTLQEFEQLHASGLATFAEFERVKTIIPHIVRETWEFILPEFVTRGQSDEHGVALENYKEIFEHLDEISKWPSIKKMEEALEVGFEVEEHKEFKRWITKLGKTNWELTPEHINQFRQLDWDLDDLLRFDSPEDMALHAIIETSPDTVSHAKLLENYKATHGTNLGNARNLHDRLQSPPFDTMVESDLDAGIIQKLAETKAKRKSAPKPKKTAKKDATPHASKALVDIAKYPKLSASKSKVSDIVRQSIESGNLETAILDAVGRLEVIAEQHCIGHNLELPPREKGWLHDLIELATSHALELSSRRKRLMHQAITTRGKRAHMKPAKPSMDQLRAVLQIAEDMP